MHRWRRRGAERRRRGSRKCRRRFWRGECVRRGSRPRRSLRVGAAVGSGDGESAWTRVSAGSPAAVGTAVATIAIVAVARAVAIAADSGGVSYPPQENRTRMAGMAAAPLRPSPCRWACPTTISWCDSPHPTRWGSMTRPVYQPGVRFDSAGAGGWLCAVGAPVAKYIRPGQGLIHSPSGGGYLPLGGSVVAAGHLQLAEGLLCPPVTSGSQNTGCANQSGGPIPACAAIVRKQRRTSAELSSPSTSP